MSQLAGGPTNEPVANDKAASQDAMLEAVLSAMPDRMFRLTRDGVYRAFKAERDEDNYAERERIIGGNIRELLPSDLSELVLEHIARALDNGTVETFEYELQYSDGLRSFQGRVSASGRDEAVVVVHEITREKQDAEAVRLSGQRLGTLIANLPGSVFILDRLGIVMFAGGRLFEKLGVAPEDLVGTSVLDFYDFPPDVVSHVTRALEGGSFRDRVEFRGSTFESRWSPLRGETGEITGTIGVALDITARVKAERSRDESDARFQVLMDHSTDVLLELREGRVTYISPNCQEALGLPPAHFVGRLAFDLVHPDDVPTLAPFFAPGWTGRIATRFRIRSGAGDWSWLEATGARVLDEAGKPRAVHVLRNIDEQVRADAALTASEAKYRNLVEGARDIVYTHDLQGNFTTVNARSVVVN